MCLMAFCKVVFGSSGCVGLVEEAVDGGGAKAAGRRLDGITPIRLMPLQAADGLSLLPMNPIKLDNGDCVGRKREQKRRIYGENTYLVPS